MSPHTHTQAHLNYSEAMISQGKADLLHMQRLGGYTAGIKTQIVTFECFVCSLARKPDAIMLQTTLNKN